ncbi:hypothetical protein [Clostridium sp. Marseille-P2415]|uniref:hypothetical protein n=1 Tax=Clostridium sp. Marseille-P2415 TaxID=1805471 RepID=UPI0013562D5A|nr:hypothetical protein [Clostridium sp. Marseille-P2415]
MKSLLHYPGSKRRIAPWIDGNMSEHHSYLNPYIYDDIKKNAPKVNFGTSFKLRSLSC